MNLKKLKKDSQKILRFIIQLLFFLTIPAAFTSAFSGVKYIFTQIGAGARIELTSFVIALIALCAYTIIFGRFFCGFACAFGSLGDWMYALTGMALKKMKKKLPAIKPSIRRKMDFIKYVILCGIVILCFLQIYTRFRGSSPWDVFSMITAHNFQFGSYVVGILLLVGILVGMCIQERFFCRFLCPMGAIFSLLPMLPLFSLHRRRENCINRCSACEKKCPADLALSDVGGPTQSAQCFQCQKCVNICPKKNVQSAIPVLDGWVSILLRAVLLFGLLKVIGL